MDKHISEYEGKHSELVRKNIMFTAILIIISCITVLLVVLAMIIYFMKSKSLELVVKSQPEVNLLSEESLVWVINPTMNYEDIKTYIEMAENYQTLADSYCSAVKKYNKWGYVDSDNREYIPFIFEDAAAVVNGEAWVKTERGWGKLDIKKTHENLNIKNKTCIRD